MKLHLTLISVRMCTCCCCCWLLVVGCCLLFVVCCLLFVGGWWLVVGGWWLVVGCWWLVVGCWLLVVGGWLLVVGGWLLVVGCWWLVVGGWLLVVGCWLLVVGGLLLLLLLVLVLPKTVVRQIHYVTMLFWGLGELWLQGTIAAIVGSLASWNLNSNQFALGRNQWLEYAQTWVLNLSTFVHKAHKAHLLHWILTYVVPEDSQIKRKGKRQNRHNQIVHSSISLPCQLLPAVCWQIYDESPWWATKRLEVGTMDDHWILLWYPSLQYLLQ